MPRRIPLSSRPLDFLYFIFMLVRICLDDTRSHQEPHQFPNLDSRTMHGVT